MPFDVCGQVLCVLDSIPTGISDFNPLAIRQFDGDGYPITCHTGGRLDDTYTPLGEQVQQRRLAYIGHPNNSQTDIKDIAKNLQIKNLIKLEAMTSEQASLDLYANALFYKPKDIYLEQLNIFDNRQIYDNVNLASYIKTDKVAIKANALHEINLKKQRLLIELEQLKNGKI